MGEHDRAPSFDELGDIVGVGKSTIHDHLHSLQRSGYLTYEKGKARTIRLTEAA
jgi:DNA-binding IclR family transcriptional regulator